jgi:hypothetical protein
MKPYRFTEDGKNVLASLEIGTTTIIGDITNETTISIPTWISLHPQLSDGAVRLWGHMKAVLSGALKVNDTSKRTFAEVMSVSPRTIQRAIKELRDVGAIHAVATFANNKQQSNVFYLWPQMPKSEEPVGETNLSRGDTSVSGGRHQCPTEYNINNYSINNNISSQSETRVLKKSKPVYSAEFDELFAIYPRKTAKSEVWRAYSARLKEGVSHEDMMSATIRYAEVRKGQDEQYTMQGKTFFGPNARWEEYVPVTADSFVMTSEQKISAEIFDDYDATGTWIDPTNGQTRVDNPGKANYNRPTNGLGQLVDGYGNAYELSNVGTRKQVN